MMYIDAAYVYNECGQQPGSNQGESISYISTYKGITMFAALVVVVEFSLDVEVTTDNDLAMGLC